jgi:hypothetical protein
MNRLLLDEAWKVNPVKEITDIEHSVLVLDHKRDIPAFTQDTR